MIVKRFLMAMVMVIGLLPRVSAMRHHQMKKKDFVVYVAKNLLITKNIFFQKYGRHAMAAVLIVALYTTGLHNTAIDLTCSTADLVWHLTPCTGPWWAKIGKTGLCAAMYWWWPRENQRRREKRNFPKD